MSKTENKPYECGECQGHDCKLWRPASTSDVKLICWQCLESMGHEVTYGLEGGSDQIYDESIGWENWVPAVPDLDGSWWGYTSVPSWWCAWWHGLPDTKGRSLNMNAFSVRALDTATSTLESNRRNYLFSRIKRYERR